LLIQSLLPGDCDNQPKEHAMHTGLFLSISLMFLIVLAGNLRAADAEEAALLQAISFYASFDAAPRGDHGGDPLLWTRYDHPTDKGRHVYEKGYDARLIRIAAGKGVQGGALECAGELPRNGMLYFPARGNLAYKKGGWGGAISVWVQPRSDTPFCDLV